tara:strand:- start:102 stop:386 length:285 start_codon:yes stop_codon:yes gene_type:complete
MSFECWHCYEDEERLKYESEDWQIKINREDSHSIPEVCVTAKCPKCGNTNIVDFDIADLFCEIVRVREELELLKSVNSTKLIYTGKYSRKSSEL